MANSFNTKDTLTVDGESYTYYNLNKLPDAKAIAKLPLCLKILLENLLRCEDGQNVTTDDINALIAWDPKKPKATEIAFTPSRVILQDFTGVPAIVDLAAMREAMKQLGGNPAKINPLSPVELVIDHSVMVDKFATPTAYEDNTAIEYKRNHERYRFLRWGQDAFKNFKVVPPGTGIVHQVNLEYLARVVFCQDNVLYPDTLVGTDSHTTMINGIGVLGWGVGGIEAEAAMLGQPVTMLIPDVIGFELTGQLEAGTTATDLVLHITRMLRQKGVVGKFVEFYGEGLSQLTLADRATISNMSPEFGATSAIFPIDDETMHYLALTGRDQAQCNRIKAYATAQGMYHTDDSPQAQYTDTLHLNLQEVAPCIAGPKRPQDEIPLKQAKTQYRATLNALLKEREEQSQDDRGLNEGAHIIEGSSVLNNNGEHHLQHGAVVIAAITSCTNTSNPAVMIASGLVAKRANELGLTVKPWVKTSFAPGSQVVTDYMEKAGLMKELDSLGFNLVGYGCTTCIGNSGPLPESVSKAIHSGNLAVAAVLSGNRNFEGRIHPEVRHAFLASPPLCVIYALAGTMDIDLYQDPIGEDKQGNAVYMKDLWPDNDTISQLIKQNVHPEMFTSRYADVYKGDEQWHQLTLPQSELFAWEDDSTYIKHPPYFENMSKEPSPIQNIENARVLALLGDSVTTDHISPAGAISPQSPAGDYLVNNGIQIQDFNSYGSRRGNHEVMIRGTFGNIRLRNMLAKGTEGGFTLHQPSGELMSIFDAAERYKQEKVPLIVIAGKEYGSGSSRDWAAKGTNLLGVKAVIAESYERIHRSNLIGMGVLPLQFTSAHSLTGEEEFSLDLSNVSPQGKLTVTAKLNGQSQSFEVLVRVDTPKEMEYYQHGGILHYVLRQLGANS